MEAFTVREFQECFGVVSSRLGVPVKEVKKYVFGRYPAIKDKMDERMATFFNQVDNMSSGLQQDDEGMAISDSVFMLQTTLLLSDLSGDWIDLYRKWAMTEKSHEWEDIPELTGKVLRNRKALVALARENGFDVTLNDVNQYEKAYKIDTALYSTCFKLRKEVGRIAYKMAVSENNRNPKKAERDRKLAKEKHAEYMEATRKTERARRASGRKRFDYPEGKIREAYLKGTRDPWITGTQESEYSGKAREAYKIGFEEGSEYVDANRAKNKAMDAHREADKDQKKARELQEEFETIPKTFKVIKNEKDRKTALIGAAMALVVPTQHQLGTLIYRGNRKILRRFLRLAPEMVNFWKIPHPEAALRRAAVSVKPNMTKFCSGRVIEFLNSLSDRELKKVLGDAMKVYTGSREDFNEMLQEYGVKPTQGDYTKAGKFLIEREVEGIVLPQARAKKPRAPRQKRNIVIPKLRKKVVNVKTHPTLKSMPYARSFKVGDWGYDARGNKKVVVKINGELRWVGIPKRK